MSQPPLLARPDLARLYRNIGEAEGLQKILKDFYERMAADLMLGFFFDGKNLETIATQQGAFLMRAMGAAPSYSGKPPAKAHDQLAPILTGHFDRRLQILKETLQAHGASVEDIRTWITFENAFRDSIVTKN